MEVIALIAGVVGIVWGGMLLWRGGLLAGLLMVLLAGVCFSLPMVKIEAGPMPLTVDRLLLVIVVVQCLVWRRFGWAEPKPLGKPEWLLLALVGVVAISLFSGDWSRRGYWPVAQFVLNYVMPLAVYWIARQTPLSERAMTILLTCLTAFGVYLALTTIAEWQQLWSFVFPQYIATTAINDGEWIGRGRGPLLHPIGNGLLLSVCLAAIACWWPRVGRRAKPLVVLALGLVLVGMYATLTRSVWISAAAAVAIIAALSTPRHWRLPLLGGGMVAAILFGAVFWENILSYKRERHMDAAAAAESAELRPVLAALTWRMFLDRPLFGCGYGQYQVEHLPYAADRDSDVPLEKGRGYVAHNVLLALLNEMGLVGLGLFLALVACWGCDAWRLWTTATAPLWARQMALVFLVALCAYFINGMFHDMALIVMANMTLFALAGWTAGLRQFAVSKEGRREKGAGRLWWEANPFADRSGVEYGSTAVRGTQCG